MNEYVCAAVTGVQRYDHVFHFKVVDGVFHAKYNLSPYAVVGNADGKGIVELADKYLKKWCGRKKIRKVTIFQPQTEDEIDKEDWDD